MGDDKDIRLTTVFKDGRKLSDIIPAGSVSKDEGMKALAGKWQAPHGEINLTMTGNSLTSVEKPFGKLPLLGEVEESESMLGLHITLGGFPMKAWMKKDGGTMALCFSNGAQWTKVESKL